MKNKKDNLNKEKSWLLKEKYNGQFCEEFDKDVKRLEKGEPVDYVIGFKHFLECRIDLSKKPLIPRPETEYWTSIAIDDIKNSKKEKIRVLDIFAGSGCIGLAVLANVPGAQVVFADNDSRCVNQIKENLKQYTYLIRANKRITQERMKDVKKSDVFKNVSSQFDFILANPPYIPLKSKNKAGKSVLKYEPKNALFARDGGLFFIKKFLKEAKRHLSEDGKIYMEFDGSAGSPQKKAIEKTLKKEKYSKWEFCKDQYGRLRFAVISA